MNAQEIDTLAGQDWVFRTRMELAGDRGFSIVTRYEFARDGVSVHRHPQVVNGWLVSFCGNLATFSTFGDALDHAAAVAALGAE